MITKDNIYENEIEPEKLRETLNEILDYIQDIERIKEQRQLEVLNFRKEVTQNSNN